MVILTPAYLTESGRPRLLPGEVERIVIDKVDIEFEGSGGVAQATAEKYLAGHCYLTTQRLIWVDAGALPSPGTSCTLPLASVVDFAPPKKATFGILAKTPRVKMQVYVTDMITAAHGRQHSVGQVALQMALRGASHEAFVEQLGVALRDKAWPDAPGDVAGSKAIPPTGPTAPCGTHGGGSGGTGQGEGYENPLVAQQQQGGGGETPLAMGATNAGVAGILRREEQKAAAADASLEQAFSDMQALMEKAKDMVELAQRLKAKLGASGGAGGSGGEGGTAAAAASAEMEAMLLEIGIASPVTRETAGALYHQELSRQLGDFLAVPLEREGGMMTLPDVYCIFNRARGTELISPEDLLQACRLWEGLGMPLRLRRFESGVLCVQAAAHSDDEVCATLEMLLGGNDRASLGARDAASVLGVPLALATEHLMTAEQRGVLCRDDGPEGLRFFRNFFADQVAV